MKYLKFLLNDYRKASRDKREVSLVKEMGVEVTVFGRGDKCGVRYEDGVAIHERATYRAYRVTLLNHLVSFIQRVKMLREFEYDVLSCHDITALAIGYIASRKRKPMPRLVYDAHEFEIGRTASRGKLAIAFVAWLEQYLMGKCAFTIVVNDSIADEMTRVHKLADRPVVVRSTPRLWDRDEDEVTVNRMRFCAQLGVDPEDAFIVMYHGAVVPGRGVEQVIKVVGMDPTLHAVVLGDGSEAYLSSLRSLAEASGAASRVLFQSAVPRADLEACVAAADIGMVIVEAISESYYYMLPNKFFENVQAEVPVVASDFPETARLVKSYDVGEICNPSDVGSIASAISTIRFKPGRYAQCKINLRRAKQDLCWERERGVLEAAYGKLFDSMEH